MEAAGRVAPTPFGVPPQCASRLFAGVLLEQWLGEARVIRFEGLSKHYGAFVAVRNLAFSVQQGAVFGFLGPNGAGKTTTIRMLMGILVPTAGPATIAGLGCQLDRIEVKRRGGQLPDAPIITAL